jgi:hypothetical protein
MIDVSILTQKARAARFATSFDNTASGPAGVYGTRKSPVSLSDRQHRLNEKFARLVTPWQRRDAYRDAVLARLSGMPGDAACRSAAINASSGYIELAVLSEGVTSRGPERCNPSA